MPKISLHRLLRVEVANVYDSTETFIDENKQKIYLSSNNFFNWHTRVQSFNLNHKFIVTEEACVENLRNKSHC